MSVSQREVVVSDVGSSSVDGSRSVPSLVHLARRSLPPSVHSVPSLAVLAAAAVQPTPVAGNIHRSQF